jgi:hypothetical protein
MGQRQRAQRNGGDAANSPDCHDGFLLIGMRTMIPSVRRKKSKKRPKPLFYAHADRLQAAVDFMP